MRLQTRVVMLRALPDPDLVEQRAVNRGFLVVPGSGGDEHGRSLVEDRDPGSLAGDDAVHLCPQSSGGGWVGLLHRLRLAGQLVGVRIAESTEVVAAGIVVEGAAGQYLEEEVRRGGNVCSPPHEAQLDLA